MTEPDQVVSAKAAGCRHCGTTFVEADHHLDSRHDKIDLPQVRPVVTRVERIEILDGNAVVLHRSEAGVLERADGTDGLALAFENDATGYRTGITLVGTDGSRLGLATDAYDAGGRMGRPIAASACRCATRGIPGATCC